MAYTAAELTQEFDALAAARAPWEKYWRDVAMYTLPQTAHFDNFFSRSTSYAAPVNAVVNTPAAHKRSKDLYDMTSLWAIERLTAGMISLKTPESQKWHDLAAHDLFGVEHTYEEKVALERLRDYQFTVRSLPDTGFWAAHRAAVKSMCAFGDGWMFIEEVPGRNARLPYIYQYMPLTELYPRVNSAGRPDGMFRLFRWTAAQLVEKFGTDALTPKVVALAQDPAKKHHTVTVMHAVVPRDDLERRGKIGVAGGQFASYYLLPEDKHIIGEGGFYEFPFTRYAWSNSGTTPYSEGPVAYALGEIKSLNEMSKNGLIASQVMLRPAYAVHGKQFQKLNLNPGAVNPNLVSRDGTPLFHALNTGARPDFAQAIIESSRNNIRELMYLNLWQIIVQDKSDTTATEALLRAQEKGELLGPVGISMNEGLSYMVDREVGILGRKGAFNDDSPLAMPDTLTDRDVRPTFTSPLDKLRRVSEVVGMQRLIEFATMLSGGDPQQGARVLARFDIDEMLDTAQEVLGAPARILKPVESADAERQQSDNMGQLAQMLQMLRGGGEAAKSIGEGSAAMAGGAEALTQSRGLTNVAAQLPGVAGAVQGGVQRVAGQPAV